MIEGKRPFLPGFFLLSGCENLLLQKAAFRNLFRKVQIGIDVDVIGGGG